LTVALHRIVRRVVSNRFEQLPSQPHNPETRRFEMDRQSIAVAMPHAKAAERAEHGPAYRWVQLGMGILCMALIANLQYGWTLFVNPMEAKNHWGLTAIQLSFRSSWWWRPGWCRWKAGWWTSSARAR